MAISLGILTQHFQTNPVGDTGEGLGTLHNEAGSVEEAVLAETHYSNYDSTISNWNPSINQK